MKKISLLSLLAFVTAVGGAASSEFFSDQRGYTRKIDVPIQADDCQSRKACSGGSNPCRVSVDHDGNPVTAPVPVQLYNGVQQPGLICGTMLFEQ